MFLFCLFFFVFCQLVEERGWADKMRDKNFLGTGVENVTYEEKENFLLPPSPQNLSVVSADVKWKVEL